MTKIVGRGVKYIDALKVRWDQIVKDFKSQIEEFVLYYVFIVFNEVFFQMKICLLSTFFLPHDHRHV